MLRARIKIFSVTDKKTEIARFLYVGQEKSKYIRDIKDEIERLYFSDLGISKHIVCITDSEGYIISDRLESIAVVEGKLSAYVCNKNCKKCQSKEIEDYICETEKVNSVTIHVDLPAVKKDKSKIVSLSTLKKASTLSFGQKRPHSSASVHKKIEIIPTVSSITAEHSQSTLLLETSINTLEISDKITHNINTTASSHNNSSASEDSEHMHAEVSDSDTMQSSTTSQISSADECASDSSMGKKHRVMKSLKIESLRKIKAPLSRYAKRK